ncbi:MAG: hypothetical protein ACREJ2_15035 [Planctomycetota bacterium]
MYRFERRTSRLAIILFVGSLAVIAIIMGSAVFSTCGCDPSETEQVKDLEQIRGMGNALTLYYKKYGAFPTLADMQNGKLPNIDAARHPKGAPACLALKLLMQEQLVTDPKVFFSPRELEPDSGTLAAMQRNLDPRADPTWYSTYAYDPGHRPDDGIAPVFGDRRELVVDQLASARPADVLTCEMVAKEMIANDAKQYVFSNLPASVETSGASALDASSPHAPPTAAPATVSDDIYTDDSKIFGWRDSFLESDVPVQAP